MAPCRRSGDPWIAGAARHARPRDLELVLLGAVFVLGFFPDRVEITLIAQPLVAPGIEGPGFDPTRLTLMAAICPQSSFLTPPAGLTLF